MTMKKVWIALAFVGAFAASIATWHQDKVPVRHADPSASIASGNPWRMPTTPSIVQVESAGSLSERTMAHSPLDDVALPAFRTSTGHVVVDAQARTDIERVVALHGREEALSKLDAATRSLSPLAQREVRDLYQQFTQYDQALATALPQTGGAQVTLDEARHQLQVLKDLRAQYFGSSNAERMFGLEESMQQQLLDDATEAMRTQNLPQAKAIEQAQAKLGQRQMNASGSADQGSP